MKDSSSLWKEKVGDVREFNRKYAVFKAVKFEKVDLPVVDETTYVKIYYTSSSGLSLKIKILDSNEDVIFEGAKAYQTSTISTIINPETDQDGNAKETRATVTFEYSVDNTKSKQQFQEDVKPCWNNEVIISITPYSELVENSRCDSAQNQNFVTELSQKDSQFYDVYEFSLGNEPLSVDQPLMVRNQEVKIKLKPDISAIDDNIVGNISVTLYYDLQFVSFLGKLMKNDGIKQKFIKYSKIEIFEHELGVDTSLSKIADTITTKLDKAFYSSDESYYEADFTLSNKFLSMFDYSSSNDLDLCFPVNLLIEYVPPKSLNTDNEDENESNISYVNPPVVSKIPIKKLNNITVEVGLSESILETHPGIDLDSSLSGRMIAQMCVLENFNSNGFIFFDYEWSTMFSKSDTIYSIKYHIDESYKNIMCYFPTLQAYENTCYKLVGIKDPTMITNGDYNDVFEMANIKTSY